ncbi:hypothetical protein BJ138DRAFT_238577 [Hygrophoropsis aurantiaca]|uniref:Uncharacterized protein n=1 Tax=Hygrophoropsis aurantiaca TaxID=72124 RepID=A0ACB7ZP49_9AGAM|nr:hypothetical protein BJ138DRAFT_238577 [Hygrophoropsis aurantiaca]
MSPNILFALFMVPIFTMVEAARGLFWLHRTSASGPLRLVVLFGSVIAISPVRFILWMIVSALLFPARAGLWLFGIGRGGPKKGSVAAAAQSRYYANRQARIAQRYQ